MDVAELLVRYVPSVSLHHVPGGGVPLLGSNHREVGRLAVTHLLECGRSVIGTVAGPFRRRVVRSRLRGAEEPINEAGAEVNEDLVVEADWSAAGASAGDKPASSKRAEDRCHLRPQRPHGYRRARGRSRERAQCPG